MKKYTFAQLETNVYRHGRTLTDEKGGLSLSFSYSGFTLRFIGNDFSLFTDAYTVETPEYFAVTVDGYTEKIAVHGEAAEHVFSVADGPHTLTVRRASAFSGSRPVIFSGIAFSDNTTLLPPPAEKKLKMEFLGDSITCGYGILGAPGEPYKTVTEDATINYAAQVAAALDAEARFIAFSGQGIVHNCAGAIGLPIPTLFHSASRHAAQPQWDFDDGFAPDVVVINAATNDVGGKTTEEEMEAGATAFLKDVRAQYPAAKIVWIYGLMNTEFIPALQKAVDTLRQTDENIWFLPTEPIRKYPGETGANGHPGILGHRRAAKELIAFIKGII